MRDHQSEKEFLAKPLVGTISEGKKLVLQYRPLMLDAVNNNYPLQDPDGNRIANIVQLNISGTTFSHLDSNPAKEIKKLSPLDTLVLVPNPENEYDPEAIRVLTLSGKQIGWVPRSYEGKSLIFRRLMEGYYICCFVCDCGMTSYNIPWCEIRITTYATPFEKSLEEKSPGSLASSIFQLREKLEKRP